MTLAVGPASLQLPVRSRSRPAASAALVLTLVADFTSSTCPVTSAYLSYARIDFSMMENVTMQQQSYEERLSFKLPAQLMFLMACFTAAFGVCALAAGARAGAGTENVALYFITRSRVGVLRCARGRRHLCDGVRRRHRLRDGWLAGAVAARLRTPRGVAAP